MFGGNVHPKSVKPGNSGYWLQTDTQTHKHTNMVAFYNQIFKHWGKKWDSRQTWVWAIQTAFIVRFAKGWLGLALCLVRLGEEW